MMKSNAALSKDAKDASAKAKTATEGVSDNDGATHANAANAHYDAKWKNEQAGNASQAKLHQKAAQLHNEKADAGRRADYYAGDEARAAETLSQKAEKSAFGKDPDELRNTAELHTDAAAAHTRASKAFELAKKPRDAAYHADKANQHTDLAKEAK